MTTRETLCDPGEYKGTSLCLCYKLCPAGESRMTSRAFWDRPPTSEKGAVGPFEQSWGEHLLSLGERASPWQPSSAPPLHPLWGLLWEQRGCVLVLTRMRRVQQGLGDRSGVHARAGQAQLPPVRRATVGTQGREVSSGEVPATTASCTNPSILVRML